MGKGGGGGGSPTQSTSYQTNLPEYARPYVETMLGATQKQLFQTTPTYDAEGNQTGTDITGFQPFKAFGGTYDDKGNLISYDPSKSVAGFTPLQEQAQRGIAGLQVPGQFGAASGAATEATRRALDTTYQGYDFANQFNAPTAYNPSQFTSFQATAPQLQQYQMGPAQQVAAQGIMAPAMQAAQTGYNPALQQYQMGPAERVGTDSFTRPGTAEAYMSPYMQNVVDIQQREARRASDIASQGARAQAVGAGAFGGTRQGLVEAERQRNLATQLGDIQAAGQQAAFQQAQQQYNQEQQSRLQAALANQQAGLTVGGQNLQALLGTQALGTQTGLQTSLANLTAAQQANVQNQAAQLQAAGMNSQQALQAALANQQAGLTVGQQNLAAQLGIQQLGAGQNLQAQLANQQALQAAQQMGEQSRQYGYGQGMTSAQLAAQYGLSAQQAAEQSRQYGAGLGLQGAQLGLTGAGQLAGIGGQELAAQQGILQAQQQAGAQQQAQQQSIINQQLQDYATAQQYPLMQLGFMSNMLRGLPMQATTTQQYQAAPSAASQLIGTTGALQNMFSGRQFAKGGITSVGYDVGGEIKSKLYDMSIEDLREETKTSSSPSVRQMAANILREKTQKFAGGGIVAFAQPDEDNNYSLVRSRDNLGLLEPRDPMTPADLRTTAVDPRYAKGWGVEPTESASSAPAVDARAPILREYESLPMDKSGDRIDPITKKPVSFGQYMRLQDERGAAAAARNLPGATFAESVDRNRLPGMRTAMDRALAPTPPAAPAAAPRPAPGITAAPGAPAAPMAPAPSPAAPAVAPGGAPSGLMSIKDFMKGLPEDMRAKPEESAEDYMKRREAHIGPDIDRQERRRQLMLERANVEDEAARRKNERLTQFFARWATTPGPTLVAGMESYKKFAEDNISDRDVRAKAMREIDKSIHELNAAARAEKAGEFDRAEEHKMKGREIAQRVNSNILSTYGHVASAQATLEGVKERAKATAAEKTTGDYSHALRQLETVRKDIEAERGKAGTPYARAASLYEAFMRQAPGGDINRLEPKMREQALSAKAVIDARHAEDERRLQPYRENVDRAAQSAGYTSVTPVTPKAPEAPEPPAQAIAALKKDPSLAKQFDDKYGAGASARILGR